MLLYGRAARVLRMLDSAVSDLKDDCVDYGNAEIEPVGDPHIPKIGRPL